MEDILYFLQQVINGLTIGSTYALIAIGYTMVYGIIGMINFAHGEIYMIGTYATFIVIAALGMLGIANPFFLMAAALLVAVLVSCAYGFAVERVAYRPVRGSKRLIALISAIGMSIFLQNQVLLARISGVVVIVFGLHFLHVFRIPFLDREARIETGDTGGSAFGAYLLGLAFAFGWTPCIGPQLGAILSMAASETSVARGTALLAVYAAGLGLPFLLAAVFLSRAMGVMNRLKRHMGLIEKVMGLLLIAVGLALLTGAFSAFSFWLLETFPALGELG